MSSIASTSRSRDHALQPLSDPVAIRSELVASEETELRLYPRANRKSASEYTIKNVFNGSTVLSVTGRKYGNSPGREFRDSSGLPLFELRRAGFLIRPWKVRLPGDDSKNLASIYMEGPSKKITLNIAENQAPAIEGAKGVDVEKKVTLKVFRKTALYTFDVLVGDQKVAHIQENPELNRSVGHLMYSPYDYVPPRRILDIRLAEGLDASIVSLSSNHGSLYGAPGLKNSNC
ncbi:unnamed protein product [Penicillium salamii]|uniref:Uncharacterized protein n=1 Tax=Penicillium salamii TaxID=1612424 RepID=A0A9W4ISX6_9EURO|nr:unnamed protein product [Penicillium salamii]CAG8198519.1 unnamed protein product [Penicillium salamii]CAG8282259.1 unnamed protein product [Penicillium salamii]CAG8320091.1 unnamed protein product [Penicillium salamii]CAG8328835.1 unnamed protein product [Penicillium salamii]